MKRSDEFPQASRRTVLRSGSALAACMVLAVRPAKATPDEMKAAIHKVIGEATIQTGKVHLDVPPLVENGNTVAISVSVESPMNAASRVKTIHLFNEKNPQPNVASFHLGPRAGRAEVATRIRLADTQTVIAIAELSDGSFWQDSAEVIVTLAACVENM
ncbi:MAG: putative sulfur oxidation protein soxY [Xanthobacteraceae bacterium]|nr:putative sulfur oxidation protein soxY [Xanthobacteraceae bacterium]